MSPRRSELKTRPPMRKYNNNKQKKSPQTSPQQYRKPRWVRSIQAAQAENEREYEEQTNEEDSIDPENTCYLREIMEDWKSVNLKNSLNFNKTSTKAGSKNQQRKFWLKNIQKMKK